MILFLSVFPLFLFLYIMCTAISSSISLILLTLVALIYIVYFGLISKPDYSLYAFLALSLFYPKSGYSIPGLIHMKEISGLSMFSLFEAIAAFTICIAVLARRKTLIKLKTHSGLKNFIFLFLPAILLSLIVVYWNDIAHDLSLDAALQTFFPFNGMIYGVIFLYGCTFFIKDKTHIERIFILFILIGVELIVETFLFVLLKLPLPITEEIIDESGRFNSLSQLDYLSVGLLCTIALGCSLYFIFSRKK